MEVLRKTIVACGQLLKQDMDIFGYNFSLWSVLAWTFVGAVLIMILRAIFEEW